MLNAWLRKSSTSITTDNFQGLISQVGMYRGERKYVTKYKEMRDFLLTTSLKAHTVTLIQGESRK